MRGVTGCTPDTPEKSINRVIYNLEALTCSGIGRRLFWVFLKTPLLLKRRLYGDRESVGRGRAGRVFPLYVFGNKPRISDPVMCRAAVASPLLPFGCKRLPCGCGGRRAFMQDGVKRPFGCLKASGRLVGTNFHETHLHVCGAETKKNTSGRSCQLVFLFMCQS